MPSLHVMLSFFATSVLLAATPGPDIIFVLTHSLAHGKKAGVWVALGNVCGVVFHIAVVALGLGTLIANSPMAFNAVRFVGASYLLYLAYKIYFKQAATDLTVKDDSASLGRRFFLQGATVSILNPQVTVLLIAFLPQFIDLNQGQVGLQVVTLGFLFMLGAFLVFSTVAVCSGLVRQTIERSPSRLVLINRAASFVFVALAIRLVVG